MKILIIENKPIIAQRLVELIDSIKAKTEIVGIISSCSRCDSYFEKDCPDLLLIDVEQHDNCIYELIAQTDNIMLVIYALSFDEIDKTIKFDVVSTLFKGTGRMDMTDALELTVNIFNHRPKTVDDYIPRIRPYVAKQMRKRIILPDSQVYALIKIDDIDVITVENRNTMVVTSNREKLKVPASLNEVKKALDPQVFVQLNRQYVVNINAINRINLDREGRCLASFCNTEIPDVLIARDRIPEVKKALLD